MIFFFVIYYNITFTYYKYDNFNTNLSISVEKSRGVYKSDNNILRASLFPYEVVLKTRNQLKTRNDLLKPVIPKDICWRTSF